ncbi:sensor histidine kinase [Neolewinella antarctica]|uniref:Signal transduction histidine kinase internal region domain-containing protein n=1 Tax=Neolewinella antarctica TaxID=442734 RepID=A0ABX0X9U6_9BACT|nr:histidine kinase [Neolewinella antarctica]NJC25957.1 hypothetical protein [Neolewinella antarctica]
MRNAISVPTAPATGPTYILHRSFRHDLLLWIGYGLFCHLIFAPDRFEPGNLLISFILMSGQAAATYLHLHYLLRPRLEKRLGLLPYLLGLVTIVVTFILLLLIVIFFVMGMGPLLPLPLADLLGYATTWLEAIFGGLGMALAVTAGLFLYGRQHEQEQRTAKLKTSQQATELAYLRGQLNPHFLFNALNGIYVLIARDPDRARAALEGFSDLLRYQLYQSEQATVPLADELAHLAKFTELQRLRTEEDFQYEFSQPDLNTGASIPPMLLLPLMENAFKYSPGVGACVAGSARVSDDRFRFTLRNQTSPTAPAADLDASGIGLANIRRRLALLFPNDHVLTTEKVADTFTVHLDIPLQ